MSPIENVSDTARWVAVYRAMESDRPDAIFHDPYARKLAGDRGEAIVDEMKRGRQMAWPMIVRTAIFDDIIMRKVRAGEVDTVVNLACGLDARAWRLPLNPELRWYDVDLPGILNYKTETLAGIPTNCRYEAITMDLTDAARRQALFASLGAQSRRALVVAEGLIVYLTTDQVAGLATDLHAAPSFQWWLIDIASPRLLQMMNKMWGGNVQAGNAPFLFAPPEGTAFFDRYGWHEAEFRSTGEEAMRLKRGMRMLWMWATIARFMPKRKQEEHRRFSGSVLLERN